MPGVKPGMTEIYSLLAYAPLSTAAALTLIAVPALTFDGTFHVSPHRLRENIAWARQPAFAPPATESRN